MTPSSTVAGSDERRGSLSKQIIAIRAPTNSVGHIAMGSLSRARIACCTKAAAKKDAIETVDIALDPQERNEAA